MTIVDVDAVLDSHQVIIEGMEELWSPATTTMSTAKPRKTKERKGRTKGEIKRKGRSRVAESIDAKGKKPRRLPPSQRKSRRGSSTTSSLGSLVPLETITETEDYSETSSADGNHDLCQSSLPCKDTYSLSEQNSVTSLTSAVSLPTFYIHRSIHQCYNNNNSNNNNFSADDVDLELGDTASDSSGNTDERRKPEQELSLGDSESHLRDGDCKRNGFRCRRSRCLIATCGIVSVLLVATVVSLGIVFVLDGKQNTNEGVMATNVDSNSIGSDGNHSANVGKFRSIYINCGGETYVDESNNRWVNDKELVKGGIVLNNCPEHIANTVRDELFCSERFFEVDDPSTYLIPVSKDVQHYRVILYFAELWATDEGIRQFDIRMQDKTVAWNYDIYASAGSASYTATQLSFPVLVTDGTLKIEFGNIVAFNNAKINAIAVHEYSYVPTKEPIDEENLAGPIANEAEEESFAAEEQSQPPDSSSQKIVGDERQPPEFQPLRIDCGGMQDSGFWETEYKYIETIHGNSTTYSDCPNATVTGAKEVDLPVYCSERWFEGSGGYSLPVSNARSYSVKLHFAELYFDDIGSRIFEVRVNGSVLKENFDILAEAGGPFAATTLETTVYVSDGIISIEFLSIVGAPKINAIEVTANDR
jgi:hypothetical protein